MKPTPAAILKSFATPPDIHIENFEAPDPGPGELLLEMLAAPINPADLNVLEGKYGDLPKLPSPVGNEGVGRVVACGPGCEGFTSGDLILPMTRGTWRRHMTVDAMRAIRIPNDIVPEQAAMLSVNPATAMLLLRSVSEPREGIWVAQNGANSGVGRSLIQIAKHMGIRTLNVVRRPELIGELRELGADVVVTETDDLRKTIAESCAGNRPLVAFNAIGGASALNLANSLQSGGTLITYGAMGKQPLKIPNGLLIFRDLRFHGFWLTKWLQSAAVAEKEELYCGLAELVRGGQLSQPVAAKLPLAEIKNALALAATERRAGKILLDLAN